MRTYWEQTEAEVLCYQGHFSLKFLYTIGTQNLQLFKRFVEVFYFLNERSLFKILRISQRQKDWKKVFTGVPINLVIVILRRVKGINEKKPEITIEYSHPTQFFSGSY